MVMVNKGALKPPNHLPSMKILKKSLNKEVFLNIFYFLYFFNSNGFRSINNRSVDNFLNFISRLFLSCECNLSLKLILTIILIEKSIYLLI